MNLTRTFAVALGATLCAAASAAPPRPTLRAGDVTLDWIGDEATGYRPRFTGGDTAFVAPHAAAIFLLGPAGEETTKRFDINAQTVADDPKGVSTTATLRTPGGSVIEVDDQWTVDADGNTFRVVRGVSVRTVGSDRAFGTAFEITAPATLNALADADVFVPGMWYGTEANTPPSSLIHDVGQTDFLFREDRMALPLVSLRERRSGWTITLAHDHPDGATTTAEDTLDRVIDDHIRFASLGLRREANAPLRVAVRYPGTEGEQTSIHGYRADLRSAERLHPIVANGDHSYTLSIRISRASDFAVQMNDAWRDAFARAAPTPAKSEGLNHLPVVYEKSVAVLDHYGFNVDFNKGKVTGVPFAAHLPGGDVNDRSLQMGFVGQQLPCASYLIDDGLRTKNAARIAQGERMVDFWARESLSPAGVPRTWFDVDPKPHWRDYHTFLRVATDGTSGMLRAWQIERAAGRNKPAWLKFCRAVGDWLLKIQNADGSFYREWNFDGTPASRSLTSTLHPVRVLIDLSCATGEKKYRDAAMRAAEWSLAHNTDGRSYVGGTPDNPDVIDKEAGWIAFDSYLALYDVTRDKRWLDAAVAAAMFTETWVYAWNVPMPIGATDLQIPHLQTTAGASLIATGHSGADLFLAYASLSYLRLSIYTGDAHFADVARLLQANTAQFVDVDGSLGYAQPGLCVEAFTLAVNRGHSVRVWLPWCTSAILEPMARSREIFGTIDVADALNLGAAEQRQRNDAWARTRGFVAK